MGVELRKNPSDIDSNYLLKRGNIGRNVDRVYRFVIQELRRREGGEEKWDQAVIEFYKTHRDDQEETWWIARRLNELMGRPLKLGGLPDWDLPPKGPINRT
jgi:hypothetical protein